MLHGKKLWKHLTQQLTVAPTETACEINSFIVCV